VTTRGRQPLKAIDAAAAIAERRGLVQYSRFGPGKLCGFEIVSPPNLAKVRMKRMRYNRCTPQWLEREASEEIADLRMYPASQESSRELWICSRKYFIRFFRVTDAGLTELDREGGILSPESQKAPRSDKWRRTPSRDPVPPAAGSPEPVRVPATPVVGPGKP